MTPRIPTTCSGAPASQPARISSGHLTQRFSPALCLLLLTTSALGQSTAATSIPPAAQSAANAAAQADKLDAYIEAEMRKSEIPSLSLAIVQNGRVVKSKAYGLANMELKVPATTNSVYQIQSITKSFVACGIMLLVEDGKIGLDDKITKYLSGLPQAWSDVTVRQLLTHTSGIPSFVQDQGSCAGKPWGQYLHDRIFAPLGMTSTRVYSIYDIIPNRASGYNHFGDVPVNGLTFTEAIMQSAAGGLVSTVEDMAKWEIALERGTILKASTLAQMAVPVKLKNDSIVQEPDGTRHGLGWDLPTWQGRRVMVHGGDHVTGFTAIFARFTDDKLAVIILTNLMPLDIGTLTKSVAGFYIPALAPTTTGQP